MNSVPDNYRLLASQHCRQTATLWPQQDGKSVGTVPKKWQHREVISANPVALKTIPEYGALALNGYKWRIVNMTADNVAAHIPLAGR